MVCTESKSRMLAAAAFLSPLVVAVAIRVLGTDPAGRASADSGAALPAAVQTPRTPEPPGTALYGSAEAAAEAARLKRQLAPVDTFYRRPEVGSDREGEVSGDSFTDSVEQKVDHELGGMMSGEVPVAIIDGKIRRIGEDLGGGWSVLKIDFEDREVTLRHSDGSEHVLREE